MTQSVPRTPEGKVDGGAIYRKGRRLEYKVVNQLRKDGFLAFRSAGSHSPIDVIGIHAVKKEIRLIQCKAGKSKSAEYNAHKAFKENIHLAGTYKVIFEVI